MMMKTIQRWALLPFFMGIVLIPAGCYHLSVVASLYLQSTDVFITPETLPDAKMGQPYYAELGISGGAPVFSFSDFVTPPDALKVEPLMDGSAHIRGTRSEYLYKIYGTPESLSDITVRVAGAIMGHGGEFDKTYTIRVTE